jgi:hypothetical protein
VEDIDADGVQVGAVRSEVQRVDGLLEAGDTDELRPGRAATASR